MQQVVNLTANSVEQKNIVMLIERFHERNKQIADTALRAFPELFNNFFDSPPSIAKEQQIKNKKTRRSKLQVRKDVIMETIKKLGFDPLDPPVRGQGKAGMKAAVKKALVRTELFLSTGIFDGVWEVLSAERKVIDKTK